MENYRKITVRLGERYLAYHSSIGNAKSAALSKVP